MKLNESMTILDIGTGNGIWALEIAAEQSKANIIGLDIRPPAELQGKPKNLTYMADFLKRYQVSILMEPIYTTRWHRKYG